jgi:predicted DNA-binding protein YlxM (UPF0122 family)
MIYYIHMKQYLYAKRDEIIWSLGSQDYSLADIAAVFNLSKTAVHKIMGKKPDGWSSPWVKVK